MKETKFALNRSESIDRKNQTNDVTASTKPPLVNDRKNLVKKISISRSPNKTLMIEPIASFAHRFEWRNSHFATSFFPLH